MNLKNPPTCAQGTPVEMHLTSDPARIAGARRTIEDFAAAAGFSDRAVGNIGLCVNEALANIIRHAYGGVPDKPILLQAAAHGDGAVTELRISIRDWGNGKIPVGRPLAPREALEPGGVGMICLRELMDEIVFAPQTAGMLLTMTKRQESGTA